MRPDRRRPRGSRAGEPVRLDDHRAAADPRLLEDLAVLDGELAVAGASARADARRLTEPAPIWSAALRGRLVGRLPRTSAPAPGAVSESASAPWSAPWSSAPSSPSPSPSASAIGAAPLQARTEWRGPRLRFDRWTGIGMAAVLALAAFLGFDAIRLPSPPSAVAGASVGATLLRDGVRQPLVRGTVLQVGDVVATGPRGGATMRLGDGEARVASDAALRISALADASVTLEQLAGRVYHRVALPDGGRYVVVTDALRWVAEGTAFDLAREASPGGSEVARLIAIEHDVAVRGDDLVARIAEGSTAVVSLTEGAPEAVDIEAIPVGALDDPWLLANGRADLALGFSAGILAALLAPDLATPTPLVADLVSPAPDSAWPSPPLVSPAPDATPVSDDATVPNTGPTERPAASTPKPTPKPTAKPTPKPTPKPTAKPTAAPLPVLGLSLTGCHGAVIIDWGTFDGEAFDHYTTLRSTSASIPKAYPPQGGAVDPGGTHTTDRTKTSAFDAEAAAGSMVYYRTMAFDAEDRVVAASAVESVVPKAVRDLGTLQVSGTAGGMTFGWAPYGGPGACFDFYKLVYAADDPTPSYLDGAPVLLALEAQGAAGADGVLVDAGTYHFRLQAIKATALGKFLVAQTDVTTFTVEP